MIIIANGIDVKIIVMMLIVGIGFGSCQQATQEQSVLIEEATIQKYLDTLADDVFLGRKPFTPGETRTIQYLESELKQIGIAPGNQDSYFQEVPMIEITGTPSAEMKISGGGRETILPVSESYVATTKRTDPMIELSNSELVFCGYGIVAPEYGKNDYEGIDMEGKTALVLVNDPGFGQEDSIYFKGNTMTYYGRWTYKYEEAARQGAEACIIIHETNSAGYPWFVVQTGWSGAQLHLESPPGTYHAGIESWITLDAAKEIMEQSGQDFAELIRKARTTEFKPVPIGLEVSASLSNTFKRDRSQNVIGILEGSSRPDEYILYSAHWDHMGVGKAVNGDSIYNGALDNASGSASLLAIAKAFKETQPAPERSILFLWVTAEEQGLLGSQFYAENPIYPVVKTVANINMDALNPFGEMNDLTITGYGQSEMDDYAREAAATQGRYILPDQEPAKGYFYRSDHFNFAKVGIPALYAQGGYDHREKGKEYALEMQKAFTSNDYHKPSDEYDSETWDFGGLRQDAQLFYEIGHRLANETSFPEWKDGSEFKARREADLERAKLKN